MKIPRQHRGWVLELHLRTPGTALALAIMLLTTIRPAQAQTYTVLYAFTNTGDGKFPNTALVRDAGGNLYGTTTGAGPSAVVFKLNAAGKETVLHTFGKKTGIDASAGLIRDRAGNLYGTAVTGGESGSGVVFDLSATGRYTVLYAFKGGTDGGVPSEARLLRDAASNLYGTTSYGGDLACGGCGVVFKLDTTGKETVLYAFTGGADGSRPTAGIIGDAAGNLYGTTQEGGDLNCNAPVGCGVVFKLDTTGKETVLFTFTGVEGDAPGALIRDAAGNFYGTTLLGGDFSCGSPLGSCGVVFKLDTTGKETVLYTFTGGADGANPAPDRLIRDAGNLYGTTRNGGRCLDCGTVFKVDKSGNETVLHHFTQGADGGFPVAGLIRGAAGNLYGTAETGGDFNCSGAKGFGCGVVFKLTP
jgi:uncharacterized repeat protein (TIGR03803 family)